MTLPKLLQEKRDELAKEWTRGWNPLADETNSVIALNYNKGFEQACDLLLPEIQKLREALKFYGNTLNWEHHNNQKPLDWGRPIIKYDDCKHVFNDEWCSYGGDKARQALQSLREFLGEKSEGGDE